MLVRTLDEDRTRRLPARPQPVRTATFIAHPRGAHELAARRHRLHCSVVTRAELIACHSATDAITALLALGPSIREAGYRSHSEASAVRGCVCSWTGDRGMDTEGFGVRPTGSVSGG